MRRFLIPLAVAIVGSGLIVGVGAIRFVDSVEASTGCPITSFEVAFAEDQTRTIGRVPAGRTLVLHDFYSRAGTAFYEILADGQRVGPSSLEIGTNTMLNFVAGISIRGGSQLAIHRLPGTSGVLNLYVGAVVQ